MSQNRSEVISCLKGRKHLGVLCYVNNKCSCPQALVQVVNEPVNYIEINAIGLDLELRSPCTDCPSRYSLCPAGPRADGGQRRAVLRANTAVEVGVGPP